VDFLAVLVDDGESEGAEVESVASAVDSGFPFGCLDLRLVGGTEVILAGPEVPEFFASEARKSEFLRPSGRAVSAHLACVDPRVQALVFLCPSGRAVGAHLRAAVAHRGGQGFFALRVGLLVRTSQ
jgi:hypothetical protein